MVGRTCLTQCRFLTEVDWHRQRLRKRWHVAHPEDSLLSDRVADLPDAVSVLVEYVVRAETF